MSDRLYLDLHILQTVPPSNLNRDDTGTPKHATYGGVRRARTSSQAWKRATRMKFAESVPEQDRATRTKKMLELLTNRIVERTGLPTESGQRLAAALMAPLGIGKSAKKEEQTAYLLFFGKAQLDTLLDPLINRVGELVELEDAALTKALEDVDVREVLRNGHPAEVALFGRMVADLPKLKVDAAVQVAHALSTHQVTTEFDYFTAVDDQNPKEETGAGMIGRVEFNAATLYRYATVGVHQLRHNLGGDAAATADTVRGFVEAFALSMPTGHQNTFAHRTVPHLLVAHLRTDQPVNLVSAFEEPVRHNAGSGIVDQSIARLRDEAERVRVQWGTVPALTLATYPSPVGGSDDMKQAFGASLAFPTVLEQVHTAVADWLNTGSVQ
jgi:CRISPR system Cascade subunit CasC